MPPVEIEVCWDNEDGDHFCYYSGTVYGFKGEFFAWPDVIEAGRRAEPADGDRRPNRYCFSTAEDAQRNCDALMALGTRKLYALSPAYWDGPC